MGNTHNTEEGFDASSSKAGRQVPDLRSRDQLCTLQETTHDTYVSNLLPGLYPIYFRLGGPMVTMNR